MASKLAVYDTGYDDERFEQIVSQTLHCIICINVIKDPVMCPQNEHLFCRTCITRHLMNSQKCPTCMQPLTVDTLTQASPGIRNLLAELKIRCDFFDLGCKEFIELGDLEKHVADCSFAPADYSAVLKVQRDSSKDMGQKIDTMKVDLDTMKVTLVAMNEKLDKNEKNVLEKIETNIKAVENVAAKIELVQQQLNKLEESKQQHEADMKKCLYTILEQFEKMTQQTSPEVQSEEMKKGIAEADGVDEEPKVVIAGGVKRSSISKSVEMFSPPHMRWALLQQMIECHSETSSVVYKNPLIVIRGFSIIPHDDATHDDKSGATHDDKSGATHDDKSGATHDDKSGATHDDQSGATYDDQSAKVQQLNKLEESKQWHEADMKKCNLNTNLEQLEKMTQQTSPEVQSEEMKKGIAEADGVDEEEPKVVIAGGAKGSSIILNSAEMFSPLHMKWALLQPMNECRSGTSSVVYKNQFIVMGGFSIIPHDDATHDDQSGATHDDQSGATHDDQSGATHDGQSGATQSGATQSGTTQSGATDSMETLLLNASEDEEPVTWQNVPAKLPGRLIGHCSVVYNGQLIVIGGYDANTEEYSDRITEISLVPPYNHRLLITMPQRRCYHGVAIFGDKILILGGKAGIPSHTVLPSVVMYDITRNECQPLDLLPYPVFEMATVKWGSENVIVMGGVDRNQGSLNKVLMYNIKTQKSHMLPDMAYKRRGCVAAVVRDTVIVMGGEDEDGNSLNSVESFTFNSYRWKELPEMNEERRCATAVVY